MAFNRDTRSCEILCSGILLGDCLRHHGATKPRFADAREGSCKALQARAPIDLYQNWKLPSKCVEMLHLPPKVYDVLRYKGRNICSNINPECNGCLLGSTSGIPLKGSMNLEILVP